MEEAAEEWTVVELELELVPELEEAVEGMQAYGHKNQDDSNDSSHRLSL
jgi:hypothetical protein